MPLRGRVQPCVRPISAAGMAAGPDEVRGSVPIAPARTKRWHPWGLPDPRLDRFVITSHHPRTPPLPA
jgi:hypothetical protein